MAKSLMIVDDSATMRKIIMRTVRMSGLTFDRTEEASNGIEALKKLEENPVDVMLCDVNMPEMNGSELVSKIHKEALCKDMKIVMVSTESAANFIDDIMKEGVDAYITKPFTPEQFQEKLSPLMN